MKTRPHAPHPADIANAESIKNAVRFEISLFLGTGKFEHAQASTLDFAKTAAQDLTIRHVSCSRKPLIYAIGPDGGSTLVTIAPNRESKIMPKETKSYTDKSNAARAAKAAGHKPGLFVTTQGAGGRWTWRPAPERKGLYGPSWPATEKAKTGKRAAILEAAQKGVLPPQPDFTAATHAPHRAKLAALLTAVAENDIKALKAVVINPTSSSPKALAKYRDLAVIALKAQQGGAGNVPKQNPA